MDFFVVPLLNTATVSDAIKILDKKGYIIKQYATQDKRRYSISLSDSGNDLIAQTYNYSNPLKAQVDSFSSVELESLFSTLSRLIYKLNRQGILNVQRTCYGCKFYQKNQDSDYCNLLQTELMTHEIRLDCPEFEKREPVFNLIQSKSVLNDLHLVNAHNNILIK